MNRAPMDKSLAVECIRGGGVVVVPTDTVYGLAASIEHPGAVGRIFDIKKRARSKPLAVLVSTLEEAKSLGIFSDEALDLVRTEWPGGLTVVTHRSEAAREIDLGGDGSTIGLRIPNHDFLLEVMRETGPLAATSANPSGQSVPETIDEIVRVFGESVDLYIDGGRLQGAPSRVVTLLDGKRILRGD